MEKGNIQTKLATIFDETHKLLFDNELYVPPTWTPKEMRGLKMLREVIKKMRSIHPRDPIPIRDQSHEQICDDFRGYLAVASEVNDGWYLRCFTPMALYSNINNILTAYQHERITKQGPALRRRISNAIKNIDDRWQQKGQRASHPY